MNLSAGQRAELNYKAKLAHQISRLPQEMCRLLILIYYEKLSSESAAFVTGYSKRMAIHLVRNGVLKLAKKVTPLPDCLKGYITKEEAEF